MKNTRLPPELQAAWEEIEGYAKHYGLDFYPIIFEVLDYRTLYETAALGGFPTRYPHWRFGMDFDQLIKGHVWLGSTIYEMVINTSPSYAYLLEGNEHVTQKMVMAHVTGHVDFFKNNMWFAHTNRKMLDEMANHASRVQRIIDRYGYDVVEDFIDTCLSLENLIDYHAPYIKRHESQSEQPIMDDDDPQVARGLRVDRDYMKGYINPPEFLAAQQRRMDEEEAKSRRFPESPQKDILLFLMTYAPLERWQHTILEIIRDEAYYFAPQGMTKILNEGWACLTANARIYTQRGLLPMREVVEQRMDATVHDGAARQRVYDWAHLPDRETVRIRTRRGFVLDGSATHRVLLADGAWRRLDALAEGARLRVSAGPDLWPDAPAERGGRWADQIQPVEPAPGALWQAGPRGGVAVSAPATRGVRAPAHVDAPFAALLGTLAAAGQIDAASGVVTASFDTLVQARRFAALASAALGLDAELAQRGDLWLAALAGRGLLPLLAHLGLTAYTAGRGHIPEAILRSPRAVAAAFLRGLADGLGRVGAGLLALEGLGETASMHAQLLLLNFGILSTRTQGEGQRWRCELAGASARLFAQQIGCSDAGRQALLLSGAADAEDWTDEVVEISRGRADVYDISVTQTHAYAAQGLINHNSFWHSEIMTKKALRDDEVISFADLHSGVVATSQQRLNPYKLGLELLRDVEERWNKGRFGKEYEECEDIAAKKQWDKNLGIGRQKLFDIRRFYNDVTFIDEFLTPEFCLEHKLFSFRYNRDTDVYEIASREFKEVKEKLLFRLTNFGQPFIYVEDGNYNNRGEIYLRHRHEGVDLKMDYARETMRNIHKIWTRPVHLESLIEDKRRLISFDGRDYTERKLD
ncbi:SpoVR family protein [Chloroflexia bacterium SDU3-3]|nr:SpoVR family protein [Chloroflexia bacterium SDU3-3]